MLAHADVHADDYPRSMRDPEVRSRRRAMLDLPHVAPLRDYAASLRQPSVEVPDFDPLDGGIEARVLFVFEKPGPMTSVEGDRVGSGFISRNNNDPTAEATWTFMQQAGVPRRSTVTWNLVPWWNGMRKIAMAERQESLVDLLRLIDLLKHIRAVVLVGRTAAKAKAYLEKTALTVFEALHPSPIVRARWPERWAAIPEQWARVQPYLSL